MKVPQVPLEKWRSLYDAFMAFAQKEPWKVLSDNIPFAIYDPHTKEMGYACVMGELGTVLALCVYRGARGFLTYRMMQSDAIEQEDLFGAQNCLMAELSETAIVEKEDYELIKKLGVDAKSGIYPIFRSYLPAYYPWFLEEKEADFLLLALKAALDFLEVYRLDSEKVVAGLKKEQYLTYSPKISAATVHFEKEWREPDVAELLKKVPPISVDRAIASKIKQAQFSQEGVWEADCFVSPAGRVMDRDRPYCGRLVFIADVESHKLLHVLMIEPEKSPYQAVADELITAIQKHQKIPATVVVRDKILLESLSIFAETFEVQILKGKHHIIPKTRKGFLEWTDETRPKVQMH